MIKNGFIMPDGTEYEVGDAKHEELAEELLERRGLKKTQKSASDSLVVSHGAIKLSNTFGMKVLTVCIRPLYTTNKTWEAIDLYRDAGYSVDKI